MAHVQADFEAGEDEHDSGLRLLKFIQLSAEVDL